MTVLGELHFIHVNRPLFGFELERLPMTQKRISQYKRILRNPGLQRGGEREGKWEREKRGKGGGRGRERKRAKGSPGNFLYRAFLDRRANTISEV